MSPQASALQAIARFRINQSLQMQPSGPVTVIWSVASRFDMLHATFGFPDRPQFEIDTRIDE
jgi:hypothetical protein